MNFQNLPVHILCCSMLLLVLLCWSPCLQTADTALQTLGFSSCKHRLAPASQLALTHVRSRLQCARDCAKMADCQVAQTKGSNATELLECRLLTNVTLSSDCSRWTEEIGTRVMVKKNSFCGFGGVNISGSCECPPFANGPFCTSILPDCEGSATFMVANSGMGLIWPSTFPQPVPTFCDFPVLNVLRRSSSGPTVFFNRTWQEYKQGFGHGVNFWWGLENMYNMLRHRNFSFGYSAGFTDGEIEGALHGISLGNEWTNYTFTHTSSVTYASQSQPSMEGVPLPFCTYDRDCNNCSKRSEGAGWWYGPNCETVGATYPQNDLWWPRSNNTRERLDYVTFHLNAIP